MARHILAARDPRVLRLAVLRHYHHRHGCEWRDEYLDEAEDLLARLVAARVAAANHPVAPVSVANRPGGGRTDLDHLADACLARIDDDLDFPGAVGALERYAAALAADGDRSAADRFA